MVFHCPSDGKVSLFLEELELGAIVISIRNLVPFWCDLLLFYGGRKRIHIFWLVDDFLPIMLGKDDSYFGKGDLFFPLSNYLPNWIATKRTSLFCRRRRSQFMSELTLVKRRAGLKLRWGELPLRENKRLS